MTKLLNGEDLANILYKILPLSVLMKIASAQGRMVYKSGHAGEVVHQNLTQYFGGSHSSDEIDKMSREFFEWERVRSLMGSLAPGMSVDTLSKVLTIEGEEHLDAAVSRGKGAILLGSHLNSILMFPAITKWRKQGYDMGVALPDKNDSWGRTKLRLTMEKFGARRDTLTEAIGGFYCQFNIRPIVRRLNDNQIIGQTGDGWHSANFVEVEFLGRKVPFTTASWSIAQLSGAAIIPMFIPGNPSDGMKLILEEPITFDDSTDKKADMERMIANYAKRLEYYILQDLPAWQHWLKPKTLDALVEWTQQGIEKRYEMN